MKIARVAVDVPLEEAFDFEVPDELDPPVGALVVVPFGRTRKVGVVVERPAATEIEAARMKPLERVVDDVPPLGAPELRLLRFCAAYYQRGLGEVIAASLPPRLRQVNRRPLRAPELAAPDSPGEPVPEPTPAQREAIEACLPAGERFHPVLLHGVTGSGKTEVYLRVIERVLAAGRQALYLVPEIGLTPQLEERVRRRFAGVPIVSGHSQLGQGERASAWLAAQSGAARIVLGTRLAVLMPFRELGAIVVDEEHDPSYKQQEGLRYSARDVAVRRAQELGIPIVLGSATPSLESYANVREGRYALARLPERATGAAMPAVRTVDTRADRPREGLSFALVTALRECVARGEQGLVFVNRRGFSPVLYCRACSWHSACPRCSANLVLHLKAGELRCHHCGHRERRPGACPSCKAPELAPVGQGTQRVEEALREALPGVRIERVDRDAVGRKGALAGALERFRAGEVDILVGTQMLAKGHDFPRLTLVGVLGADNALYSADFRATERLGALLFQVAGRAGRADLAGEVIIATDFPGHALYRAVAAHDYQNLAEVLLADRRVAGMPPYSHLVMLAAEAPTRAAVDAFLQEASTLGREHARTLALPVEVFAPVPATLARRAGMERGQVLVQCAERGPLQRYLPGWRERVAGVPARGGVRWTIDVDPIGVS